MITSQSTPRQVTGRDVELQSYSALQNNDALSESVLGLMLTGTSTRDYGKVLDEFSGGMGPSKSSVQQVHQKFDLLKVLLTSDSFQSSILQAYHAICRAQTEVWRPESVRDIPEQRQWRDPDI
jgi:hypothetical protein